MRSMTGEGLHDRRRALRFQLSSQHPPPCRHASAGWHPALSQHPRSWTPAFAGVTVKNEWCGSNAVMPAQAGPLSVEATAEALFIMRREIVSPGGIIAPLTRITHVLPQDFCNSPDYY